MLFTKSQEYALQAMIHLALTPDEFRLNREIAERLDVPGPYLAKVLKRFAQMGYLESAKGRGGGFRIGKRALQATVLEIVSATDGSDPLAGCVLGMSKCSDHAACPLHDRWVSQRTKISAVLQQQSIARLAMAARKGKTRLAPQRQSVAKR